MLRLLSIVNPDEQRFLPWCPSCWMYLEGNPCIDRWKLWLGLQRSAAGVDDGMADDFHGNTEEERRREGKEDYIALTAFVPETESCV
jgi:hypothetical protein